MPNWWLFGRRQKVIDLRDRESDGPDWRDWYGTALKGVAAEARDSERRIHFATGFLGVALGVLGAVTISTASWIPAAVGAVLAVALGVYASRALISVGRDLEVVQATFRRTAEAEDKPRPIIVVLDDATQGATHKGHMDPGGL